MPDPTNNTPWRTENESRRDRFMWGVAAFWALLGAAGVVGMLIWAAFN
jgi:hypothetical protein